MEPKLLALDDVDSFEPVKAFPAREVSEAVISAVRVLDEREEIEPFIRTILTDVGETPHGPAEIVDILTPKIMYQRQSQLAAFILKGKSFPTVRPKHVAHQIYRLEKIIGLRLAALAYTGTILDAAKEQFCSTAERLGCLYLILDAVELARLFIAFGFFCPRDGNKIMAGRCRCGYSPAHRILNVLQEESLKELAEAHRLNQPGGLIVLPPGSGKTRIAAEDAKRVDSKNVLYVAHTHEILDVAESEFRAKFGFGHVKRITKAKDFRQPAAVNIATIQLLQRHVNVIPRASFDYLVVDEFHHAAAPSYRHLLERVTPRFLLGLTATPFRGDRQDILQLCGGNVLLQYELRSGIEAGVLSPYHYYGCFDDVDYSEIRHNGYRYDIRDLERALVLPERNDAIVEKWRELAKVKPTLAFCCSQKHAHRFAQHLQSKGVPAEVYLSDTSTRDRARLGDLLRSGAISILCAVDVLNEGADLPYVECLLFLRPTESKRIFYQQLGRGLRRYVGKSHCVVIDFIGNFKNAYKIVEYHGLLPVEEGDASATLAKTRSRKELLNLPLGCQVNFDARVIDVFAGQVFDPRLATRHNIARILMFQYQRLAARIGHRPSRREVDRNCWLDSRFYELVFGTWARFIELTKDDVSSVGMVIN